MSKLSLWNFLKNANALFEYKYRYRRGYSYLKGIEERKKKWGPENPIDANYQIMAGKMEKKKYEDFSRVLEQFVREANVAGAKVLVVMIPDSVQLNEPDMQFANRFVARICAEIGVPFIDVTPILEAEEDHGSLYLFPHDAHNSPKGFRLIAESIGSQIIKLGLLVDSQ